MAQVVSYSIFLNIHCYVAFVFLPKQPIGAVTLEIVDVTAKKETQA